ncbi:TadE/TadG family type IV pilus assembly protein [Phycicoccus sonneratiae]|uniref:Pilus assembly protein n=1 Tax=Phycicoccus sonneratiae TaxID=2807628 RepID=A0ABS2CM47_9MICO|nr:TadE/TadG family type IV pilus assembly protein [Phycicoccus sonneraticus]MBM6400956.1 pilus assembly protein [Phycicoccus sonneraticus]
MALEAALVFMFLFFLLAGVIDISMFFKDTYSVSSAARAGARMGSADPMSTTFAASAAGQAVSAMSDLDYTRVVDIWVYEANDVAGNLVSPPACPGVTCVKYTVNATGALSAPAGTWLVRNACAGTIVDSVGVQVRYTHKAPVMFANNKVVTERVSMRLEQIPTTQACASVL